MVYDTEIVKIAPEFFVYENLLNPTPHQQKHTENSILFLAEYCLLYKLAYDSNPFIQNHIKDAIDYHRKNETTYMAYPNDDYEIASKQENVWSHDNFTAIVVLSKIFNLQYHNESTFKFKGWTHRIQPWNLLFWAKMKNGNWFVPIFWLLSPIIIFKHLSTMKNIHTSGKILAFIQCKMLKMQWLEKLCVWYMKKFGYYSSWEQVFAVYFKYTNHPINQLVRNLGDEICERNL